MASERTDELYKILLSKGYPKELCAEIALLSDRNAIIQKKELEQAQSVINDVYQTGL